VRLTFLAALFLLFLAAPAWGVDNASELACDNMTQSFGSGTAGVRCGCSEPLTADNGVIEAEHNPIGSTGPTQCQAGGNTLSGSEPDEAARSVRWDDPVFNNPMQVGGSGWVIQIDRGNEAGIYNAAGGGQYFTGGTYCERFYILYEDVWECNYSPRPIAVCTADGVAERGGIPEPEEECTGPGMGTWAFCNRKFSYNYDDTGEGLGLQGSFGHTDSTFKFQVFYGNTDHGKCKCSSGGYGTSCNEYMCGIGQPFPHAELDTSQAADTIDEMKDNWIRWDQCWDHDLSQPEVLGAGGLNETYYTSILWPGGGHVYMRAKATYASGPRAGEIAGIWGPGVAENSVSVIRGATTRVWMASNNSGSYHGFSNVGTVTGNVWTAYNMTAFKQDADSTWWIGPALEVESAPSEPTGVLAWQP
jgi:hypothetical protein